MEYTSKSKTRGKKALSGMSSKQPMAAIRGPKPMLPKRTQGRRVKSESIKTPYGK